MIKHVWIQRDRLMLTELSIKFILNYILSIVNRRLNLKF
jgi:hypothetical protein